MSQQIITGIIYFEMNDELGPNPKAWLPTKFSQMEMINISIKTLTVLSGEHGLVPESLVILPFTSLNSKGLIKFIRWEDSTRRGGIGVSALSIMFQEMEDVIFYKYINQFSIPFEEILQKIIDLELSKAPREKFIDVLKNFEINILNLLEELKFQERDQLQSKEFPEQQYKDRSLIDYQFKIIILGDPSVGKTSLILRYTDNAFRRSYVPTLGVHVSKKIFKIEDSVVQLTLWDIGGQLKFQTMRQQFYRGSDAAFLVFDLTRPDTFKTIPNWYTDVLEQLSNRSEDLIGYIVGNKNDLKEQRKITKKRATTLANQLNLAFIETSALLGENVDYAFSEVARLLYKSLT
ncbi:hypothetical protein LCGC14_0709660 [marine sediment metagenome]|uniref:GTP-binding protein n=2 Tax=marine sediment metagenome TaxID=412755 RepID=A0A0F9TN15_9ZZZZ